MPAHLDISIALIGVELELANVGHQISDFHHGSISKFDVDFETFQEAISVVLQ
jgi:hypothetical protein